MPPNCQKSLDVHTFSMNNRLYALHVPSGLVFEIDSSEMAILGLYNVVDDWAEIVHRLSERFSEEKVHAGIHQVDKLIRFNSAFQSPSPRKYTDRDFKGFNISASVLCNLRCEYCYAIRSRRTFRPKVMPREVIKRTIEHFERMCLETEADEIGVVYGLSGEPLLNKDLLHFAYRACKDLGKRIGKKINFSLTTNGTAFTDEIIQFIREGDVSLYISLDGPKELNDTLRPLASGRGSYDIVVRNAQKVLDRIVMVQATLSPRFPYLVDVVTHLLDLGFRKVRVKPLVGSPLTEGDLQALKGAYSEYARFVAQQLVSRNESILRAINFNDFFGRFLLRILLGINIYYRCEATNASVAVAPDGRLFPCDMFLATDQSVGNIIDGLDSGAKEIWRKLYVDKKETCRNCWARYFCGGGCYYNAYIATGDIRKPDPMECDLVCHIVEQAIWTADTVERQDESAYAHLLRHAVAEIGGCPRECLVVTAQVV